MWVSKGGAGVTAISGIMMIMMTMIMEIWKGVTAISGTAPPPPAHHPHSSQGYQHRPHWHNQHHLHHRHHQHDVIISHRHQKKYIIENSNTRTTCNFDDVDVDPLCGWQQDFRCSKNILRYQQVRPTFTFVVHCTMYKDNIDWELSSGVCHPSRWVAKSIC